jgi:hypothetical protein
MSQPILSELTEAVPKPETLEKPKKIAKSKVSIKTELPEEDLLFDLEDVPETPKRRKGRPKKVPEEVDPNAPPKPKRVLSDHQKAILEKARKVKNENFQKREEERQLIREKKEVEQENKKKDVERKILKKAVSIKKKQILQEAILEDDDDDIPTELVEKIIKKQRAKRVAIPVKQQPVIEEPPKSKYTFVA